MTRALCDFCAEHFPLTFGGARLQWFPEGRGLVKVGSFVVDCYLDFSSLQEEGGILGRTKAWGYSGIVVRITEHAETEPDAVFLVREERDLVLGRPYAWHVRRPTRIRQELLAPLEEWVAYWL